VPVRWIGEYKPEYKYHPISSTRKRPRAFLYSLGGDKSEYRGDLQRLGITIYAYNDIGHFYHVVLDDVSFKEIAESLWWVKGIYKQSDKPEIAKSRYSDFFQYPGLPTSSTTITESTSTTSAPQNVGPCYENDEGKTRNRSRFPEHPELFRPMPIPDPTKKPPKPSKDDPEVPENHTIGNGDEP